MISNLNGYVWRVRRGQDPVWMRMYQDIGVEPKDVHESEWRWANVDFSTVIHNDLGLEELKSQVKDHLVSTSPLAFA